MNRARWIRAAVFAVLAAGALILLGTFAPLYWPSVFVYFGIAIVGLGLAGCMLPVKWTALGRRGQGLRVAILGAGLLSAGLYWPASASTTPQQMSRLDAFLPDYHFHEVHEMRIQAPPDQVMAALRQVRFEDVSAVKILGRIRNAAMGARNQPVKSGPNAGVGVIEIMSKGRTGFFPLDLGERELVFGMAGQPWKNRAVRLVPEEFRGWMPPGNVKIAFNFKVDDTGGGWSRMVTETRIQATDDAARGTMAKYWRLVYPGSGLIRRGFLDAVRRRAAAV